MKELEMNAITVSNPYPMKAWKEVIDKFYRGVPCFLETDLNNLDVESDLFYRYCQSYKWHFRDSHRSLLIKMERNLTPYEFSYYDRMREYFGIDQVEMARKHPNNIICNWEVGKDHKKRPRPCFVTAKFIPDKEFLHLSVTFRTRDVIKRMYPNFVALRFFLNEQASLLNKKPGKLFDYSNQIIADNQDLARVRDWKEFIEYV